MCLSVPDSLIDLTIGFAQLRRFLYALFENFSEFSRCAGVTKPTWVRRRTCTRLYVKIKKIERKNNPCTLEGGGIAQKHLKTFVLCYRPVQQVLRMLRMVLKVDLFWFVGAKLLARNAPVMRSCCARLMLVIRS
jgi:hypothetical protein